MAIHIDNYNIEKSPKDKNGELYHFVDNTKLRFHDNENHNCPLPWLIDKTTLKLDTKHKFRDLYFHMEHYSLWQDSNGNKLVRFETYNLDNEVLDVLKETLSLNIDIHKNGGYHNPNTICIDITITDDTISKFIDFISKE